MEQAIGVMNIRNNPQPKVCKGAFNLGLFRSHFCFSNLSKIIGKIVIPGMAMMIRDKTTCEIPFTAATCKKIFILLS